MVIRMLSILRREKEKYSEIFNDDLENIRQNQSELMNTITEKGNQ